MSSTASKQQQLATSLRNEVVAGVKPELEGLRQELIVELKDMKVNLATIAARVEMILKSSDAGGAKKPPRGTTRKPAAGAAAPKANGANDAASKVTNSALYCRKMWAESEEFRNRYYSDHAQQVFEADNTWRKKTPGEDRLLCEGGLVWRKNVLDDAEKKAIKHEYDAWKLERDAKNVPESLEKDGKEEDDTPAEDDAVDDLDDLAELE